jgi:2,4-dienoyl-CoA reductase (NADPH2)
VTLYEAAPDIGGQFNMAMAVPGKEEFRETIRYFRHRVADTGVDLRLDHRVTPGELDGRFDEVVVATGVIPRRPPLEGIDHPKVLTYPQVLRDGVPVGHRVAVIGAGGIGVDVCAFLLAEHAPRGRAGWSSPRRRIRRARSGCSSARPASGAWGPDPARPPAGCTGSS